MDGSHYTIDGQRFVRVTAVCSVLARPYLATWRGKIGNDAADKIMREAAAFGTRLHEALQGFAQVRYPDDWIAALAPDLMPFAEAFLPWWRANVEQVIDAERLLVSRQFGYAGTTDLVAVLTDGATAIVDWKSSKAYPQHAPRPDPTWRVQTVAYAQALREQDGLEATRRLVVQLPSNDPGALHVHEFDQASAAADWLTFRSLLHCYRWQEGLKV